MLDREIGVMAKRLDEYDKVLRCLALRVDGNDQKLIRRALEQVTNASLVRRELRNAAHSP